MEEQTLAEVSQNERMGERVMDPDAALREIRQLVRKALLHELDEGDAYRSTQTKCRQGGRT